MSRQDRVQEVGEESEWIPRIGKVAFGHLAKTKTISIWFFAGLAFMLLCFVVGAGVSPMPKEMFAVISVPFFTDVIFISTIVPISISRIRKKAGREAALYLDLEKYRGKNRVPGIVLRSIQNFDNYLIEYDIPQGGTYDAHPAPGAFKMRDRIRSKERR